MSIGVAALVRLRRPVREHLAGTLALVAGQRPSDRHRYFVLVPGDPGGVYLTADDLEVVPSSLPTPMEGIMTGPTVQPTQARHPWRATARTVLAAAVPLVPLLPELVDVLGLRAYAWAGGIVATAGVITRVLALPGVNGWLQRYVPALAAAPKGEPRRTTRAAG